MWLWMYESWCQDLEDKNDFAKNYAIFQGSFANPEMARKMIKSQNPDFESSEEDFEHLSQEMLAHNRQAEKSLRKRQRKILKQGSVV